MCLPKIKKKETKLNRLFSSTPERFLLSSNDFSPRLTASRANIRSRRGARTAEPTGNPTPHPLPPPRIQELTGVEWCKPLASADPPDLEESNLIISILRANSGGITITHLSIPIISQFVRALCHYQAKWSMKRDECVPRARSAPALHVCVCVSVFAYV